MRKNKQISCIKGLTNSCSHFTLQERVLTGHSSVWVTHDILPKITNVVRLPVTANGTF